MAKRESIEKDGAINKTHEKLTTVVSHTDTRTEHKHVVYIRMFVHHLRCISDTKHVYTLCALLRAIHNISVSVFVILSMEIRN